MSALKALALARAHDVAVELKGDQVRLLSRGPPPEDVLAALKTAKGEIIALMTPDTSGATGVDYWFAFDERLADRLAAGVEPELARLEAFDAAFNEWLKQSFDLIDATADQSNCAHCGKAGGDALLPIGPNAHGCHAWIHDQCHEPWRKARQIKALAALSAYGLGPPQPWLLARAESEAYEREIVDWWRKKPESYPDDFHAAWATRMLEEIKTLGFRAYFDDKGALLLADATGGRRPPPAHATKGLGRIKLGLRADPGLIEAIWPSGGARRPLTRRGIEP
jgi:hypothetical protein